MTLRDSRDCRRPSRALGCHGEAPCSVYGLSYGERESQDVRAAYDYLAGIHRTVYAFGSSVGASSIFVALPDLPQLAGVIAENPIYSFRRLIKEAPEAQAAPGWFSDLLINVALWRGRFDGLMSPAAALSGARANVPILLIHSTEDRTVSYTHTQQLADLYSGPKTVWLPDHGSHAAVWDVNQTEYEQRVASFLSQAQ